MSKNSRSKRHHYIPKAIQRAFVISETKERIWYADRDDKTGLYGSPEIRNIESTFMEKNLYTVNYDSTPSDVVEKKFYQPLDNHLGIVLPRIIAALDGGVEPIFSREAERSMRLVVIEMMKRTPTVFQGLEIDEMLQRALNKPPSREFPDHVLQAFKDKLKEPKYVEKFKKEVFARGRIRPLENVNNTLEEFSIRWAVSRGNASFILSGRYCYMIGNGGPSGLANMLAEVWMPICPKYCMVLVRDPYKRVPILCDVDSEKVRKFNLHSAKNSDAIASHSEKLIESIVGKKSVA